MRERVLSATPSKEIILNGMKFIIFAQREKCRTISVFAPLLESRPLNARFHSNDESVKSQSQQLVGAFVWILFHIRIQLYRLAMHVRVSAHSVTREFIHFSRLQSGHENTSTTTLYQFFPYFFMIEHSFTCVTLHRWRRVHNKNDREYFSMVQQCVCVCAWWSYLLLLLYVCRGIRGSYGQYTFVAINIGNKISIKSEQNCCKKHFI